jgi:drug/metabolite transporter (DMT)-like permease
MWRLPVAAAAPDCNKHATMNTQSHLKAALWMAGWITSFLVMSVAGRAVVPVLDVFQVMELRSVLGFVMLLPLVWLAGGLSAMRTDRPLEHLGRNAAHYAGQFAWFAALGMIPLAELIAIEFTTPFWGSLLAVAFLGETLNGRAASAMVLGLLGVLVIVRPAVGAVDPGHLVILAGSVGFGVSIVMTKALTRTESVVRIMFWMLIIQSAIGLVPAIAAWQNPPVALWPAILVIAFTGAFSHYCLARALFHADAMVVMPMDFLRLPGAALVGWLLYQEVLDGFTAAGAFLILAGNLLNLQRRTPKPAAVSQP